MLQKGGKKEFDSMPFVDDNIVVHLPRVEGAEQPAYQVRLLLFLKRPVLVE